MGWFKSKVEFAEGDETTVKVLIESLLLSPKTIIEIDFTNAKFDLYNEEEQTSVAIDSIGVKVDIVKEDEVKLKVIALDSKFTDTQISHLKDLVAKEATIRRENKRKKKFLNRTTALLETINSLKGKNGTINPERN